MDYPALMHLINTMANLIEVLLARYFSESAVRLFLSETRQISSVTQFIYETIVASILEVAEKLCAVAEPKDIT